MKTITVAELQSKLLAIKGALPIAFSALVDARTKKTGNPYPQVLKLSRVNGFTGANYENSVNRQLGREGTAQEFHTSERKWGERISPALVRNGPDLYLVIQPQHTRKPVFFAKQNGLLKHVAREKIAAFLPAKRAAANQGTEKEIVYRNYKLESLVSISLNGEVYKVHR